MHDTRDDESRFSELYRSMAPRILAYAARRTPTAADAADICAETFIVAWRRIGEVPGGEAARPWLYGVARNVLANQRRGHRRRSDLAVRLAAEYTTAFVASTTTQPAVSDVTSIGEGRPASTLLGTIDPDIAAALVTLTERDREVLLLIAWDDLTITEAAAVLGCRPGTLRVRLHRARERFREALAPSCPPVPATRPMTPNPAECIDLIEELS